jgi:hypothetical protein
MIDETSLAPHPFRGIKRRLLSAAAIFVVLA